MAEKQKKSIFKRWWFWVIAIVIVLSIITSQGGGDDRKEVAGNDIANQVESNNEDNTELAQETKEVQEPERTEEPQEVGEPVEPVVTDEEETTGTLSQKNAVRKAKDYLSIMAFSKSGLIEQLEFEGFSNEDATYAVNQVDVDWKEQAVKKAED